MCIRKDHSLAGQLVRVRRWDLARLRSQALDVTVPKIVANDVNDVGFCGTEHGGRKEESTEEEMEQFHSANCSVES